MKFQRQCSTLLVFKNNFRKRQIPAVCNGQRNVFHAQILSDSLRGTAQTQRWLPARLSYDFDIAPPNAPSPARPQRFHRCFFRREATCVALEFISVAFAIRHFARSVQTLENGRAVPHDGRLDPVNFRDIQSQPDYQFVLSLHGGQPQRNVITCEPARIRDYTYN